MNKISTNIQAFLLMISLENQKRLIWFILKEDPQRFIQKIR